MHKQICVPQSVTSSVIDLDLEALSRAPVADDVADVSVATSFGRAIVARRIPLADAEVWAGGLEHVASDHRYYEVTHASLGDQFDHRYLILQDRDGVTRAIQPFLIVDQDLTTGLPAAMRNIVGRLRRHFPATLVLRMLMIGCSAGEGNLVRDRLTGGFDWVATALGEALQPVARALGASMVVFKDFPKSYRAPLASLNDAGYVRVPSMPGSCLELQFKDFEEYLSTRLSHKTRKNLRHKYRKAAAGPKVELQVVRDITPYIDEVFPLYRQVVERSKYKFEELTRDYFLSLSRAMEDRTMFFIWRQEGRAVAFSSCLCHDGVLRDHYIGLDYRVALESHLYFVTWRDIFTWALENGYRHYYSAPLNYEPKYHLRHDLVPLDLYVRSAHNWINPLIRRIVPFLEPTRYDPIIPKFTNAHELW